MKRLTLTLCCLVAIATGIRAQSDAEMKAWMAYMTPGDMHKMLAKFDGEWSGEVTMWMAPGAPPMTSKTTSTNKMMLDGRYQYSSHKGSFNGMPFEGISTVAYDNAKKVFLSSWIDNMGTGMMNMEGVWDASSKTITFKGKMVDPTTGKEVDVRETFKIIDDNNQVMEMYGPDPKTGKEYKTMEIKYTRAK